MTKAAWSYVPHFKIFLQQGSHMLRSFALGDCLIVGSENRTKIKRNSLVVAVCISEKKGVRKKNVGEANLVENFGLENDAQRDNGTDRSPF